MAVLPNGDVKICNVRLNSPFGGNAGMSQVLPASIAASWSVVTVGEAFPVVGAPGLTQAYVWSADYSHLVRQVERVA